MSFFKKTIISLNVFSLLFFHSIFVQGRVGKISHDLKVYPETSSVSLTETEPSAEVPLAAVLEVYSKSLSSSELFQIANILRRELKNSGRYLVYSRAEMKKALSKNLDEEITAARKIDEYVAQARKLYDEFKFDSAAAIMKEAMGVLGAFDSTPAVVKKVSEAYLTQGLILEALNQPKEAEVSFLNAAALAPDLQLDPTLYPPNLMAKFYQAKTDFSKIKEGVLRIETSPPVAKILLNGKVLGNSPHVLKNLPLGVQKVTLLKEGFDPWEKNIMIVAADKNDFKNRIEVNLERKGEFVSLEPMLGEVIRLKTYDAQLNKMAEIGKLLLADHVFTARIEKEGKEYRLYLVGIDVKTHQEIGRGESKIEGHLADADLAVLTALKTLFQKESPERWIDKIAVEGRGGLYQAAYNKNRPFYKKWPFYLVLGIVVAGGGAGGIYALTRPASGSATLGNAPKP